MLIVDDEAGGAGGIGINDLYAVAERAGGHGGHAAELSSAKDADGGAGQDDVVGLSAHAIASRENSCHCS